METFDDHYQTMGLLRFVNQSEIKKKYRQLAKLYHPDKNPGNPFAEERFKKIQKAHDVLIDPEKRRLYDLTFVTRHDYLPVSNPSYSTQDLKTELARIFSEAAMKFLKSYLNKARTGR